ncbi:glycosyl transferase family 2 [Pacificibacter maritimus]|uniref:Glycosyl transferase family 2 n=1 Tax=Pacificibacter maritimus TaxID=762213 RepID=A0A3N4UBI9_9RHOB|nr:glycosyltransferase family 2 protein [Pacificibacter maritimus]RPE67168.1 glycosyl transferase family 2 [Pacificibacter maritimus]
MTAVAITCIRNEGPWLLDWIAHHLGAGFDHFVIASHECTDGTDSLLQALNDAGIITHVPFQPTGDLSVQWQAMKVLSREKRYKSADLALFFDVDEYLVLNGISLDDLMAKADAVPLRWHLFGHSGHSAWVDAPVTQRFTHKAPDGINLPLAHFFKTLHRPKAFRELGIHRPKGKTATWISASGAALPDSFATQQSRINLFGLRQDNERAWLNHYSVRSIEEFVLKSARGLPNHMSKPISTGYWAERNFNTVIDTRIAQMSSQTEPHRNLLAAFDDLHHASLAHHKADFVRLKQQRATLEFMWQLELMAGSTPPSAVQLADHIARLKSLPSEDKNG